MSKIWCNYKRNWMVKNGKHSDWLPKIPKLKYRKLKALHLENKEYTTKQKQKKKKKWIEI